MLDKWEPNLDYDKILLQSFKANLSLVVSDDPRIALASILANTYFIENPSQLIDKWIGMLMSSAVSGQLHEAVRSVYKELEIIDLQKISNSERFYMWTSNDFPPVNVTREENVNNAVITGQRPTVAHLRNGFFAYRPIFKSIHKEIELWIDGKNKQLLFNIPVFWISGCSGSGKSVALLHALSYRKQANPSRVILWLRNRIDLIDKAVYFSQRYLAEERELIIAFDDPYTHGNLDDLEHKIDDIIQICSALKEKYPNSSFPSLICCGPHEQSIMFREALADYIELNTTEIPTNTENEVSHFRNWFKERTGRLDLPVSSDKHVLMVQMFFEWQVGSSIDVFSARLKKRLQNMMQPNAQKSVFSIVAEVLALNRLYALYPYAEIEYVSRKYLEVGQALDILIEKESHFSLVPELGGIRLTHPHLADAIYSSWFRGEECKRSRQVHLYNGIKAWLQYGKTPSSKFSALWAISRLLSDISDNSLSGRLHLIHNDLIILLQQLYKEECAYSTAPLTDYPVWVNIVIYLGLRLDPSPVVILRNELIQANPETKGFRLSCHTLLQYANAKKNKDRRVVEDILSQHRNWRGWPHVALDYIYKFGLLTIKDLLIEYIKTSWKSVFAKRIIMRCFVSQESSVFLREIAFCWLQQADTSDSSWPAIFTEFVDLFGFCSSSSSMGLDFLRQHHCHPSWSHVWERLYAVYPEEKYLTIAKDWLLTSDQNISGWTHTLERLINATGKDDQILSLSRKWLDNNVNSDSYFYILSSLLRKEGSDKAELLKLGNNWILSHSDEKFIVEPFRILYKYAGNNESMLNAAIVLMTKNEGRTAWPEIFVATVLKNENNKKLIEMGIEWLKCNSKSKQWLGVFCSLFRGENRTQEIFDIGKKWLIDLPDKKYFHGMFSQLIEVDPSDSELVLLGKYWLARNPYENAWPNIFLRITLSGNLDDEFYCIGERWLNEEINPEIMGDVYYALLTYNSKLELLEYGRNWLRSNLSNQGWSKILYAVTMHSDLSYENLDYILPTVVRYCEDESLSDPFLICAISKIRPLLEKLNCKLSERARKELLLVEEHHLCYESLLLMADNN